MRGKRDLLNPEDRRRRASRHIYAAAAVERVDSADSRFVCRALCRHVGAIAELHRHGEEPSKPDEKPTGSVGSLEDVEGGEIFGNAVGRKRNVSGRARLKPGRCTGRRRPDEVSEVECHKRPFVISPNRPGGDARQEISADVQLTALMWQEPFRFVVRLAARFLEEHAVRIT